MIKILFDAYQSRDDIGRYICIGVFSMIACQTTINIGMVLGMTPVIGITLPFFSSGGSSMLSILISIGLVQSVYAHKNDIIKTGILLNNKYKYTSNLY